MPPKKKQTVKPSVSAVFFASLSEAEVVHCTDLLICALTDIDTSIQQHKEAVFMVKREFNGTGIQLSWQLSKREGWENISGSTLLEALGRYAEQLEE